MTRCEPCALHEAGQNERAKLLETIRAERITLALLNGAADTVGEVTTAVGDCLPCAWRLATAYLVLSAGQLVQQAGSVEAALQWAEQGLAADLDAYEEMGD